MELVCAQLFSDQHCHANGSGALDSCPRLPSTELYSGAWLSCPELSGDSILSNLDIVKQCFLYYVKIVIKGSNIDI